ncbi:MAG: biopolymer transporter ExbD [Pontiellaceae bacterium]|jgi:biopolymer transport protein ExbD|nr:biopolymer transporter ExbD [Pontiellaceae bacterium]
MIIKSEDTDLEIDMSPMIDMVFLLLIFFIVAASQLEINKPKVVVPTVKAAKVPDNVTGRISVSINRDKAIFINTKQVKLDELKGHVKTEVEKDPDLRIFIRADEEVPYEASKEIMVACSEAGAVNLIYSALEK